MGNESEMEHSADGQAGRQYLLPWKWSKRSHGPIIMNGSFISLSLLPGSYTHIGPFLLACTGKTTVFSCSAFVNAHSLTGSPAARRWTTTAYGFGPAADTFCVLISGTEIYAHQSVQGFARWCHNRKLSDSECLHNIQKMWTIFWNIYEHKNIDIIIICSIKLTNYADSFIWNLGFKKLG